MLQIDTFNRDKMWQMLCKALTDGNSRLPEGIVSFTMKVHQIGWKLHVRENVSENLVKINVVTRDRTKVDGDEVDQAIVELLKDSGIRFQVLKNKVHNCSQVKLRATYTIGLIEEGLFPLLQDANRRVIAPL
jgi:hypothetical protein